MARVTHHTAKTVVAAIMAAVGSWFFVAAHPAHATSCCAEPECCNAGNYLGDDLDRIEDEFEEQTGASDEENGQDDEENVDDDEVPEGRTSLHFDDEMQQHTRWWVNEYFVEYTLPAMMIAAERLSAVGMYEIQLLGTLLDGKQQAEALRAFSALSAQAQRDYHPSDFLCSIGSGMRSLAGSERNMELTTLALGEHALDRELLNGNANSSEGPIEDMDGRLAQFRSNYCDVNDFSRALQSVCVGTPPQARRNRDIDYTGLITVPMTLNINFSDQNVTDDESDVMALAANIFSHDVFRQVEVQKMDASEGNRQRYLDLRAVIAKRSVAEYSFNAIAGMKASGSSDAAQTAIYLRALMRDLGLATDAEADAVLGANPSYYAQMEILTKKIYQNPDFIAGLYDKPANVARRNLATQAFTLMQSQDLYESDLRMEAMLAVWLETEIMKEQSAVQKSITNLVEGK